QVADAENDSAARAGWGFVFCPAVASGSSHSMESIRQLRLALPIPKCGNLSVLVIFFVGPDHPPGGWTDDMGCRAGGTNDGFINVRALGLLIGPCMDMNADGGTAIDKCRHRSLNNRVVIIP